jgi:hypothetical protein
LTKKVVGVFVHFNCPSNSALLDQAVEIPSFSVLRRPTPGSSSDTVVDLFPCESRVAHCFFTLGACRTGRNLTAPASSSNRPRPTDDLTFTFAASFIHRYWETGRGDSCGVAPREGQRQSPYYVWVHSFFVGGD